MFNTTILGYQERIMFVMNLILDYGGLGVWSSLEVTNQLIELLVGTY